MKKHIAQWVTFTILFALIPLLLFLIFSLIFNNNIANILNKCFHELFFYSIMVSAATINDLLHTKDDVKNSVKFIICFGFIILLMTLSASIYGMIIFADNFIMVNIINLHINTLFVCSVIISIFTTVLSYLAVTWRNQ